MYKITENFISVTELQKNTKKCLSDINEIKTKVILSNNQPKAILISLDQMSYLLNNKNIPTIIPNEEDIKIIENHKKSQNRGKGVEAKSFLSTLMQ